MMMALYLMLLPVYVSYYVEIVLFGIKSVSTDHMISVQCVCTITISVIHCRLHTKKMKPETRNNFTSPLLSLVPHLQLNPLHN